MTLTGRLVRSVSGFYTVRTDEGEFFCRARGVFRKRGVTPLVGDFVTIEVSDGSGSVVDVAERRNALLRPPVCNIDALVMLVSEAAPRADTSVIDKMAALAAYHGIEVILLINKCDLEPGDTLFSVYRAAGFPVLRLSALTGDGLESLWPLIENKCVALAGNSGVGKSELLNALDGGGGPPRAVPGLKTQGPRPTGEVSERLGRGRHTTRHVELYALPRNVLAADTPGFAALDTLERIPPERLGACFLDFRPYLGKCRFAGCLHGERQRDCAVREAVGAGEIHPSRYAGYLRMLEEE
ncbi:MAG: ribosome small subunit-dependent GTPase A [Oscillospiraceae bacterium]|jgi:ribosome biogenesis GTPase|nr:ribosome small subunit-dependent GTPase A [Oscillospiraceae bacterium]